MLKKALKQLDIFAHCRSLNVGLFSCPSFIFLIMGVVIITTVLATYFIAQRYTDPEIVIVIVTLLTVFLLIIAQVLVNAFEKVVYSRLRETTQAKEILELKDQFVYIAVHDLSAAATAIKWGLRTIEPKLESLSPLEKEVFTNVRIRNQSLIELVRQIQLITRIEGGHLKVASQSFAIEDALQRTINELERIIKSKNISINLAFSKKTTLITSDPEHVGVILRILTTNAINHAAHTDGKVHIEVYEHDSIIDIRVENNGPEMDKAVREHIFEKVWRDDKGKRIEGTGFGLYTVKELARVLQGNVEFSSLPDKTEFILTLPKG